MIITGLSKLWQNVAFIGEKLIWSPLLVSFDALILSSIWIQVTLDLCKYECSRVWKIRVFVDKESIHQTSDKCQVYLWFEIEMLKNV